MSVPGLTTHARVRLQQRAVPPIVIEMLERFGTSTRCRGADRLFFDRAAKKRLCRYLGGARSMKVLEPWLDTSVVVADSGAVVTIDHRYKRIPRD